MPRPDTDDFLSLARDRFKQALSAEHENREEAMEDLRFLAGGKGQWNPKIWDDRDREGRPAISINKVITFFRQIANEARINKPSEKVVARKDGTTETAEVIEGLLRAILVNSDADIAADTAAEYQVACGFGYMRIVNEFEDDDSDDQVLLVGEIPNPFSVVLDPAAKKRDRRDMRYGFILDRLRKEEFRERWPKAEVVSAGFYDGFDNPAPDWISVGEAGDMIQIAEYWVRETSPNPKPGRKPLSRVTQYLINGVEILEEHEWPGDRIPIIPVYGPELWVNGKRKIFSAIRFLREPQQLYNYVVTCLAEVLGTAPRSPYVAAVGQIKTKARDWQESNTRIVPVLEYDPVAVGGQAVGPPQRQAIEPPIQALMATMAAAAEQFKEVSGIFDASLGARSNETSGIAIQNRQREGDVGNFHFQDNLSRALRSRGRLLVDLLPHFYSGVGREERILGLDMAEKIVRLNQQYIDQESGKLCCHMLAAGKYDVTVTTGPSYTTKRLEAFDLLTQLAQAYPQLMQIAGHIIFRNSDIPGADEIADLFKAMLPPNLQAVASKDQAIPPQAQAQIQQLVQQQQQLTQLLQAAQEQLKNRTAEKQLELSSKEKIAHMQAVADLIKAEMQVNEGRAEVMMRAWMEQGQQELDRQHERRMQEQQHAHEAGLATITGASSVNGGGA